MLIVINDINDTVELKDEASRGYEEPGSFLVLSFRISPRAFIQGFFSRLPGTKDRLVISSILEVGSDRWIKVFDQLKTIREIVLTDSYLSTCPMQVPIPIMGIEGDVKEFIHQHTVEIYSNKDKNNNVAIAQ